VKKIVLQFHPDYYNKPVAPRPALPPPVAAAPAAPAASAEGK
jgi:hypothetical protein